MTIRQRVQEGIFQKFMPDADMYTLANSIVNALEESELTANAVECDDIVDSVYEAVERSIIYYDDQWTLMRHYQLPEKANLMEAIVSLIDDLLMIINQAYQTDLSR